jgi:alpha-1,2-mannosyltransferase
VTGAEVRRRIVRAPVALGVAVGAALLALAGHAVVLAIWPDAHTLLIDLEVYRAGGRFLLDGRPLYERGVVLDLLPFVYPPVAAVLFAPLALVAMPVLKVLWTALGLALLACTARRCARAVGVAAGAPTVAVVVLVTALATWLDPVRTTLYLGQINIVLLALVLGDLLGRRDSRWRGVGLGLAAAVKLTPLLFVAYLLLRRRYRAAATAVATFVAAGAVGFLLAPADSVTYWLRGTFAAADRIAAVDGDANHSLNGLVTRLLGPGPVATVVYLLAAAALVATTLLLARRALAEGDRLLAVSLVGLCSAAAAPFAWSHHWVWVVPLLAALAARAAAGSRRATVLAVLALATTLAVVTRAPGPDVGPIPSTGLISLLPDAYLLLSCSPSPSSPSRRERSCRDRQALLITTTSFSTERPRGGCRYARVCGMDGPFLGSQAVAMGLLTPAELRTDRFVPIFRDVFVEAGQEVDLALRSRGAHLLMPPDGALCGHSAATLLGAACSPPNAAAELIAPRGDVAKRRGLAVRQAALLPAEVCEVDGLRVTTPMRTAYDLGRRLDLVEAVAAVDALARIGRFAPSMLLNGPVGARGRRRLREVVGLADPLAESVMETRLRILLVLGGLPRPVAQFPVIDADGVVRARVDLAYPAARLALEYDGAHHFTAESSRRDRQRDLALDDLDWQTMRFTVDDVLRTPGDTVRRVRHRLAERHARFAA